MMDGIYSLWLRGSELNSDGVGTIRSNRLEGHDGVFKLSGSISRRGDHALGDFQICFAESAVANSHLPLRFSLSTTGTAGPSTFSLLGAGPLGLIIELSGERK